MKRQLISGVLGGVLAVTLASCSSSPSAPAPSSTAPVSTTSLYVWGRSPAGKARPGRKAAAGARRHHVKRGHKALSVHRTPVKINGVTGTIVQVSTSNSDAYALTSAGAVYAWGAGSAGELGDGSTPAGTTRAVRVDFPSGVKIASLPDPMPFDAGMAIDTKGHVWGWGNDQGREFCQPQKSNVPKPIEIPLSHVTAAVGALMHTTYDAGGKIVSCGMGINGQLGNGTTTSSATPTPVKGLPAGQVTALVASWGDAGALMANGSFYDWGYNHQGQLGDGTDTLSDTAVHVSLPAPVKQVSQGGSTKANGQTLALLTNGQVWEWGDGAFGQLGNGKTTNAPSPVLLSEPKGVTFVNVNSGGATNFAIDSSGRLWSWGLNSEGQLGTGSLATKQLTPVPVDITLTEVSSTAAVVAGFEGR